MRAPILPAEVPGATSPGASAPSTFILASNLFVKTLLDIADSVRATEPGTAALLLAYAEREAGLALDLVRRWP